MDEVTKVPELNNETKPEAIPEAEQDTELKAGPETETAPGHAAGPETETKPQAPADPPAQKPDKPADLSGTREWKMDLKKAEKAAKKAGSLNDPAAIRKQRLASEREQAERLAQKKAAPEGTQESGTEKAQEPEQGSVQVPEPGKTPEKAQKEDRKKAPEPAAKKEQKRRAKQTARRSSFRKHRRKKHKKKHYLLKTLVAVLILAAAAVVIHLPYFYVNDISVIGNKAFSDEEIIKQAGVTRGWSIFYVHPVLAEHKVKKNNLYISDIDIDRHLPSTVTITVNEKEGTAQILIPAEKSPTGQKQYVIIDETGKVLELSDERKDVTLIRNVTIKEAEAGKQIEVKEKGTYRDSMKMIKTAEACDFYFKRVELTGSMAQGDVFDDLFVKGRYDNIITSLEKGTLKTVVYMLYQEGTMHGTINIGDNDYCSFTPEN